VVVLHDLVLHHLMVEEAAAASDMAGLELGLRRAHGDAGRAIARAREVGIRGRLDPFLFPARVISRARAAACVVHSRWAAAELHRTLPGLPVGRVGLSAADPGPIDRDRERADLGLQPTDVVLMHVGFLTPQKGLEEIVASVVAARSAGVPAVLVLVGEGAAGDPLDRFASRLGARSWIRTTGWVDERRFLRVPAAADLGVVLRTPSAGETSAAAVRFLAAGTPVAVAGHRQFLDLPERAAPRITPGPSAAAELARLMASAGGNGDEWRSRRAAARRAYERGHRPADVAEALLGFLGQIVSGPSAGE
jgi:alpha-1,6-mannosyltransferase